MAWACCTPGFAQEEDGPKPRVFKPMPCHPYHGPRAGVAGAAQAKLLNYDMTSSIARSDTFDILSYHIELDVTQDEIQWVEGHTTLSLVVLQNSADGMWLDLKDLAVDSVHVDGAVATFDHTEDVLRVHPPTGGGWTAGTAHEVEVWYGGHPYRDPVAACTSRRGMYTTSASG